MSQSLFVQLDRVAVYRRTGGLAIYELLGMAADAVGPEADGWLPISVLESKS